MKANFIKIKNKPRILQKYIRETDSLSSLKKQEKTRNSSIVNVDIETQTEWSWLQDLELIQKCRLQSFKERKTSNSIGNTCESHLRKKMKNELFKYVFVFFLLIKII
jgi:hypothetical protein